MDPVSEGDRVELKAEADPAFGGWCCSASNVDPAAKTAFVSLTHKPDCTVLRDPVPLRRVPWDMLDPCHCA